MDWLQHLPWGSILTVVVTLVITTVGVIAAYVKFRTTTEIGLTASSTAIADPNKRVSDLAAGASSLKTEVIEFKSHFEKHFVAKDEIADLRSSFEKSIDRVEGKMDTAIGTLSDVRDEVIKITAKGGRSSVRRRAGRARRRPRRDRRRFSPLDLQLRYFGCSSL